MVWWKKASHCTNTSKKKNQNSSFIHCKSEKVDSKYKNKKKQKNLYYFFFFFESLVDAKKSLLCHVQFYNIILSWILVRQVFNHFKILDGSGSNQISNNQYSNESRFRVESILFSICSWFDIRRIYRWQIGFWVVRFRCLGSDQVDFQIIRL